MTDDEYAALLNDNRALLRWATNKVMTWREGELASRAVTWDDMYGVAMFALWRAGLRWTGEGCWRSYVCQALIRTLLKYSRWALRHVKTSPWDEIKDERTAREDKPKTEFPGGLTEWLKENQARCLRLWHYDVHLLPDDPVRRRRVFVVASHARTRLRKLGREKVSELLGVS